MDREIRERGRTRAWWRVGVLLGLGKRHDHGDPYVLGGRLGSYEHVGYGFGPALELSFARVMRRWRIYVDAAWFPGQSTTSYSGGLVFGFELTTDPHRSRFTTFFIVPDDDRP